MNKKNLFIIFGLTLTLTSCSTGDDSFSYITIDSGSSENDISSSEIESSTEIISSEPHIHIYGEVTYIWNTTYTKLRAFRTCIDGDDVEEEEIDVIKNLGKDSTCTEEGYYLYTSEAFTNPNFEIQTHREVIPLKDHHITSYVYKNETHHYLHCGDCDQNVEEALHRYDEGEILQYAYISHGEKILGTIKYTCLDCGYEDIRAYAHTELEL